MDDDYDMESPPEQEMLTQELENFHYKLRQGTPILRKACQRASQHGQPPLFSEVIKWYRSLRSDFEEILERSRSADRPQPRTDTVASISRQGSGHGADSCPLEERVTILEKLVEELFNRALFVDSPQTKKALPVENADPTETGPITDRKEVGSYSYYEWTTEKEKWRKKAPQRPGMWKEGKGKVILCQCCHERKRGRVNNLCNTCETVWYRHRTDHVEHIPQCNGLMRPQDPQCKTCIIEKIKALKLKPVKPGLGYLLQPEADLEES